MLTNERNNGIEVTEEILTDYCEGLSRMLSSLYSHTTNNVLRATMSWKLLERGKRFQFSHEYVAIPFTHLLQWVNGDDNLEFKLRRTKTVMANIVMYKTYT